MPEPVPFAYFRERIAMPNYQEPIVVLDERYYSPGCSDCARGLHGTTNAQGNCRCCGCALPADPVPLTEHEVIENVRNSRIPTWIDLSNVVDVDQLHSSEVEVTNTIEIGYLMERLCFHEINDDTAAHLYSRVSLLGKLEGPQMQRSDHRMRVVKCHDLLARIGMKVTGVAPNTRVPEWPMFVNAMLGSRWDADRRRAFRSYMRDMGGH